MLRKDLFVPSKQAMRWENMMKIAMAPNCSDSGFCIEVSVHKKYRDKATRVHSPSAICSQVWNSSQNVYQTFLHGWTVLQTLGKNLLRVLWVKQSSKIWDSFQTHTFLGVLNSCFCHKFGFILFISLLMTVQIQKFINFLLKH